MPDRVQRDERRVLSRREFTSASVLALLATVPISIAGCDGGDDGTTPAGPSPSPGGGGGGDGVTASISANHGHAARVTQAQITAAADIVLGIQGQADHPHTVTITGAELTQIGNGSRVSKQSTVDDAHSHIVTFN